ncbi:DUF87 domain-containing protein [Allomuricauda taeanensis]|uniref:ATP-binding protein n=1 Tax=Flagellimonas taeanensis TaxID=1005926 RepID=UPI002E7BAB2A|nr:DUF87 domain-containing protein [Allomuricauda taeanensis]MEE1962002.1 DUF87 domain-containing protein [Allomuricauda taeanensis]
MNEKNKEALQVKRVEAFISRIWFLDNGFLKEGEIKIKHAIYGFKLKSIPYFDIENNELDKSEYLEAILRQKNFIDTTKKVFLNKRDGLNSIMELRIVNNPLERVIDCYLIIRFISEFSSYHSYERLRNEFIQLIPTDYELVGLDENTINKILNLEDKEVVEVRKKLNFLNVGSFFFEENCGVAPRNIGDWEGKERFKVPVTSYLEPKSYNLSSLFENLQLLDDEVHIRISLSSYAIYDFEKNIATQYFYMINNTYANIMTAEVQNSLHSLTKYTNQSSLYGLKVQVASKKDLTAISIANLLGGQLTLGEMTNQTDLEIFALNNTGYSKELIKNEWENCEHFFYNPPSTEFLQEEVEENIYSFLRRMPYLNSSSEVFTVFRLPISQSKGLPGMVTKQRKPFYLPNPKTERNKEIEIGKIITGNSDEPNIKNPSYTFSLKDLTKHGLIVGSTGSGKTNTTLNLVKEFKKKKIPFLIIEPVKSEYYEELSSLFETGELNRFNFKNPWKENGECNPEFLRFNPLIPIKGIPIIQHISYIKGCFGAAFPMHGIMPLVLENSILKLYEEIIGHGKVLFDENHPVTYYHDADRKELKEDAKDIIDYININGLSASVSNYLENKELFTDEDEKDFGSYLKRRFEKMTDGTIGHSLNSMLWKSDDGEHALIPNSLLKIFTEPTIIELEAIPDNEDKALIMALILTYLFEYRQTQPNLRTLESEKGKDLKIEDHIHVTIIEEAHRLLNNSFQSGAASSSDESISSENSQSKSLNLFVDMLAEIRAKGESIFIVEQMPTKLIPDAIKNTNLKIMHRISSKDDREYLGSAMNMNTNQKKYVNNLKTGDAIIFEEGLDNPIFVKMNLYKNKDNG